MTAPDNETSTTIFDGFATFIDDDNLPGFESLNKSTFFDQVMNASKLFDGDVSSAKLNESLARLNESFSVKSAIQFHKNRNFPTVTEELCFSVEEAGVIVEGEQEEEEEDDDDAEDFEEELLFAFLQKKLDQRKQEEAKSGKRRDDGESVTTATASLSSNGSVAETFVAKTHVQEDSIKETPKSPAMEERKGVPPLTREEAPQQEVEKEASEEARIDLEEPKKKPSSGRKPAMRIRSAEDTELRAEMSKEKSPRPSKKLNDRSERQSTTRRPQRRASLGSLGFTPAKAIEEGETSSLSNPSMATIEGGTKPERSSIRRTNSRKAKSDKPEEVVTPETPRRKIRDRSKSLGKTSEHEKTPTPQSRMELGRVKRTPKRGSAAVRRASLGQELLRRNFEILDKQMELEVDSESSVQQAVSSDPKKKHDVWKNRRARSFAGPSVSGTGNLEKRNVLELANRVSSIQAAAVAAVANATEKMAIPRVVPPKLNADVDAALARISQVGIKARNSIKSKNHEKAMSGATYEDDLCVAPLQRASTKPTTPLEGRRLRRRGSCA